MSSVFASSLEATVFFSSPCQRSRLESSLTRYKVLPSRCPTFAGKPPLLPRSVFAHSRFLLPRTYVCRAPESNFGLYDTTGRKMPSSPLPLFLFLMVWLPAGERREKTFRHWGGSRGKSRCRFVCVHACERAQREILQRPHIPPLRSRMNNCVCPLPSLRRPGAGTKEFSFPATLVRRLRKCRRRPVRLVRSFLPALGPFSGGRARKVFALRASTSDFISSAGRGIFTSLLKTER